MRNKILLLFSLPAVVLFAGGVVAKKLPKYDAEIIAVVKQSVNDEPPLWFAFTHFTDKFDEKSKPTTRYIQLTDSVFRVMLGSALVQGPITCAVEKGDIDDVNQKDLKEMLRKKDLPAIAWYWGTE